MQGYNAYYQSPASMQASSSSGQPYSMDAAAPMSAKYAYEMPAQSLESFDMTDNSNAPRPYAQSRPSQTPSSSSSASTIPTLALSPTSYRSSISSSAATPITPLELSSPTNFKEGQNQDSSWFAAMQESYLANNGQQHQQSRPSLQRMQRMSISGGNSQANQPRLIPRHANSQFLGVAAQPPRRASVATFQPTPSRMSQTPSRPSIPTAANSEPILHSQNMREYRSASYQAQSGSQLTPQTPRQAGLSSIPQQSPPVYQQGSDVNRLYAEVFGSRPTQPMYQHQQASSSQFPLARPMQSPVPVITAPAIYSPAGQYQPSSQVSPQSTPFDNYNNYAGVLLQPEDLHMLAPEPLSPTASHASTYMQPAYSAQNSGWQTSFSLSVPPPPPSQQHLSPASPSSTLQPALPIGGQSANWNFASFHGFAPIVTPAVDMVDPFERPASAPPVEDLQSMAIVGMDRRRGSSVDSAKLLPFQPSVLQQPPASMTTNSPYSVGTPAYFGSADARQQSSNLLVRRSTVGPTSLNLNPVPQARYPATPSPGSHLASLPSVSMPMPIDASRSPKSPTPSPTARRTAGRSGSGGSRRTAGGAPMFINFTSKDANKLLSGVAPSGSSKRKREEEEAKAGNGNAKMIRTDDSSTPSANGSPST